MSFLFVAGIVILATLFIVNVNGLAHRKSKTPKITTKDVIYPGPPGTSSVTRYPYPDSSFFQDSDDGGCCGRGKKKTAHLYPYPYGSPTNSGPIAGSPPTTATGSVAPGFAQEFGTIGGSGGVVVQINTLADLIQNVGDNIPRVLMINSDIKASTLTKVQMGSFKSIVGNNGNATLYNIYLRATPASQNIIFQSLIFKHSPNNKGNDDIQLYLNYGRAYWIDHCSFVGHTWSANDGSLDKLLYIGEQATGATISYCNFANHKFGLIFGYPNDNVNAAGGDDTRVTIFNNRFENITDRAPGLFRFGEYHVYNNYINNYGLGFTVSTDGQVISEFNYFGSSPNQNAMLKDYGSGRFIDTGSVPPITTQKSPKPDWSPPYHYNLKESAGQGTINTVNKYVEKRKAPPRFPPPLRPISVPPPMQSMDRSQFLGLPGR